MKWIILNIIVINDISLNIVLFSPEEDFSLDGIN